MYDDISQVITQTIKTEHNCCETKLDAKKAHFFACFSSRSWQAGFLQQKAIHITAFHLATQLEPFVIFSLVIGRWHDVTMWVFYQTQTYYFRKSFWCDK